MFHWKLHSLVYTTFIIVAFVTAAEATFPGKNGRIVFIEGPDIWTMNPDGTDELQLTAFGSSGEAACCAAWSADGRHLVFTHVASDISPAQVWMMNADGSGRHQVLNDPNFWDDDPSFSPDGGTVVFERCPFRDGQFTGGCELFHMRVNGTGLTTLIPFGPNIDIFDVTPGYSPDGKTIAFAGFSRAGLISAIYLMNADGSHIRPLTPPGLEAFMPNWSPDGNSITFSTRSNYPPNTFNPEIWIMNKDGSGLRQFTFPGAAHDFWPSWSPQGDAMAFERDNAGFTQFGILVKSTGTSAQEDLVRRGSGTAAIRPRSFRKGLSENMRTRRKTILGAGARLIEENSFLPRWGPAPQ